MTAPPPARRDDVVDVIHGVRVADPYRWLEDGDSQEVATWVAAQNACTQVAFGSRPERAPWHERLVELLSAGITTGARFAGGRVFCLERTGGAAQFALVWRSALDRDQPAATVLDPSTRAADGTAAIDWFEPSVDGRLVAYGVSEGGDERSVLFVRDVDRGVDLDDRISETRAASVAWLPDSSGFYYTRYPPDSEYGRKVYYHALGADPATDQLIFGADLEETAWPLVNLSSDGSLLLVHVAYGWDRSDVHLLDRRTGTWADVVRGEIALTEMKFGGPGLIGVTSLGAPRSRVVGATLDRPADWTTIVPESDEVVVSIAVGADAFVVSTLASGSNRLRRYSSEGPLVGELELPGRSSVIGLDADTGGDAVFFQIEGFTRPATLYRYTPSEGVRNWARLPAPLDPDDFVVEQIRYRSPDGTNVPMFIVRAARTVPTPETPCILTGYGGFNIALTPVYGTQIAAWCERGGLYAVAGIRGGNEEGGEWHRAGQRANKQNVFDDFHAAADWLVANGLTSRSRLALRGGSNGGLLMGAAITQRPDLARAVHCAVPLLDMVRFPRFLIARLWIAEYGDPDIAEEFAWLYAYSPYHHVREATCYPAVLFTTAEGDSRVDPCHALKMAALLQSSTSCGDDHPILLRVEERAGHGIGKPVHKQADELADVLAFFSWQLGAPIP